MADSSVNNVQQLDLPLRIDLPAVKKLLRAHRANARTEALAAELTEAVRAAARPKAIYRQAHVDCAGNGTVEIDGIRFSSRALSKNLAGRDTVFPYIATVGHEVDKIDIPRRDMWRQYCFDVIKTVVLVTSLDFLTEHLKEKYAIESVATMNPGEIADFPIEQQRPLFALFGGAERQIGVTLTKGGAMHPTKSRSGIFFPNDTGFVTCRLCTQQRCPGRSAAYDPEVVRGYLGTPV
ncbi:MAG: hypothetical protein A2Z05_05745 [Chloroflexi bacterium RBG_16_60_22]|nr:MAG: hypothetical protein A2Z05_05745 [Chloroflexi bacterium RBG_16_60_22]